MALDVIWAPEAIELLEEIIAYLKKHWSEKVVRSFVQRLDRAIEELQESPDRYKKSLRKPDTHEFKMAPQTTIFYSFDEENLYILLVWPNRKNPELLD